MPSHQANSLEFCHNLADRGRITWYAEAVSGSRIAHIEALDELLQTQGAFAINQCQEDRTGVRIEQMGAAQFIEIDHQFPVPFAPGNRFGRRNCPVFGGAFGKLVPGQVHVV